MYLRMTQTLQSDFTMFTIQSVEPIDWLTNSVSYLLRFSGPNLSPDSRLTPIDSLKVSVITGCTHPFFYMTATKAFRNLVE